jgi:hypothetical protein
VPELALFVTGTLVTLVVVVGCFKLGQAEQQEARVRAESRRQTQ